MVAGSRDGSFKKLIRTFYDKGIMSFNYCYKELIDSSSLARLRYLFYIGKEI